MAKKIAVVLKGYPRLSETFIAQELHGLEQAGHDLILYSLRHPTDAKRHPVHGEIRATVRYLPEYLSDDRLRVLRAWARLQLEPGYWRALPILLRDLWHEPDRHRMRRIGQALVLAAELDRGVDWLHAHFIHTPGSVAYYASLITGLGWSCSAHAKDIWTSSEGDLRRKLDSTEWVVTCTRAGYNRLRALAARPDKVHLSYHGLDLGRFGRFEGERPPRDGSNAADPAIVLSVGRAVEKKGYDVLLRAFAVLPQSVNWRFIHIGGGDRLDELKALAKSLGIASRVEWRGALDQADVITHYRAADLFALACRVASDGDRDGLPNVLVEAASQRLCAISTALSGVTELLENGVNSLVIAPDDPQALAGALERGIRDPKLRLRLGQAAEALVRTSFDHRVSIAQLARLFAGVPYSRSLRRPKGGEGGREAAGWAASAHLHRDQLRGDTPPSPPLHGGGERTPGER